MTEIKSQVLIALLFGDKLNSDKLEFGLNVGPNFAHLSNCNANGKTGLALGLYFDIKLSDKFSFHPEALPKSPFGGNDLPVYSLSDPQLDETFKDGTVQRKIKYISMPLLFRYKVGRLLFAEAGPQISLRTKATDIFQSETSAGEIELKRSIKNEFTRFDLGLSAGFGCKFKKEKSMAIGVRYYQGMIDVMKNNDGKQQNSGVLLYLSVPVGAKKSASKKST